MDVNSLRSALRGRRLAAAALFAASATMTVLPASGLTQTPAPSSKPAARAETPFAVEYYYKAKWGFADEFARLFQ